MSIPGAVPAPGDTLPRVTDGVRQLFQNGASAAALSAVETDVADLDTRVTTLEGASGFTAASQAEMEAASSTTVGVTPGRQQYHPSAVKVWVYFNTLGTVLAGYNVTSVTDTGAGDWTVVIATDFSSTNYAATASGGWIAGTANVFYNLDAGAVGSQRVVAVRTDTGNLADPTNYAIAYHAFGDQ